MPNAATASTPRVPRVRKGARTGAGLACALISVLVPFVGVRLALGLPAPDGFRAFVGGSYIPPVALNEVSTNYGALEAGFAWAPGPFHAGIRGHALYATSRAPVTDPTTRDTLETVEYGADLSAGWAFALRWGGVEPYAGAGVVRQRGRFRVTSDGVVLRSTYAGAALHAGVRLRVGRGWEGAAELDAYPGRLVHPLFRLGYLFR